MIEDLDQILQEEVALDTLLHGSNSKNYNLNTTIFKIVQTYIAKTRRFS